MAKTAAPTGIEKAHKLKLGVNDIRVLKALKEGPLAQYELSAKLEITKQALSYNVTKIVTANFAERLADKKISITPAGKKAVAEIV